MLCDKNQSNLLIIDIQEKLVSAMPADVVQQVIRNTKILIETAKALAIPLLLTEQYPQGLGVTVPELKAHLPAQAPPLFDKTCFSGCGVQGVQPFIENPNRQHFIITGMESHVCVLQTALELRALGREVFVVADAVCSRRKLNYRTALARLQQAGVIVTNTESIFFEWMRDANHPQFKTLSKLIR
jgi:nicotinamidase-related amidase